MIRDYVALTINGEHHHIRESEAFMMLADYLRLMRDLSGTKIVCAEGDCGACTVLCSRPRAQSDFMPINACIALVAQLDNAHILTVESLKEKNNLSPIQEAFVKAHASQCGFCTPGFVMALTALFEKEREPLSPQRVKNQLSGNLCRCTGYDSIIQAALQVNPKEVTPLSTRFEPSKAINQEPMHVKHGSQEIYAPRDLSEAVSFLNDNPNTKILGAATDLGVMLNKRKAQLASFMSLHLIPELGVIEQTGDIIKVGAAVTLAELREYCRTRMPELARFINIFASLQIRNMATLIGNIANASPIADTLPFLMVSNAQVKILSAQGERELHITKLFEGYKRLGLSPHEFITQVCFSIPNQAQIMRLYKITQRRDLDIATVNGAFCFEFESNTKLIKEARIALGGVAETAIRVNKLEQFFSNKKIEPEMIDEACALIQQEIKPLSDLRGSASFRRVLVSGMLRRYLHEIERTHHGNA